MRESALRRALEEAKRRLDGFDVHGIPSEEYRRAVYTIYEIVRDIYAAVLECEKEFDEAYEAFKRIAEKQDAARAREFIEAVIGDTDDEPKKAKAITGNYL